MKRRLFIDRIIKGAVILPVVPSLLAHTPPRVVLEETQSIIDKTTISAYVDGYYVSLEGNDCFGDGSFNNPYRTIQRAVEASELFPRQKREVPAVIQILPL